MSYTILEREKFLQPHTVQASYFVSLLFFAEASSHLSLFKHERARGICFVIGMVAKRHDASH